MIGRIEIAPKKVEFAQQPMSMDQSYTATAGQQRVESGNYRFLVEIEGIEQGGFLECTGLGSSIEVIPYHSGNDKNVRKLPGKVVYSDIVLRWGVTAGSIHLYNWYRDAANGNVSTRNVAVMMTNERGEYIARWDISNAWPCAYEGPYLNAADAYVAIESLTLVCERIDRVI
jgi:phage tail-like protein